MIDADSCSCPYVDGDSHASAIDSRWRTARKEHRCCECGKVIAIGERYEYTSGIWDGDPQSFKTCATCKAIREGLFCDGWTYGYLYQDLSEFLLNCFNNLPWAKIRELPKAAQDEVVAMINEIAEERI